MVHKWQRKYGKLTRTGNKGEEILLWADLYLYVSNMRNANRAQKRLTHNFPRKRIISPMTFTLPMRNMLFIIRPVAIEEALQNPLPVIAICTEQFKRNNKKTKEIQFTTCRNFVTNTSKEDACESVDQSCKTYRNLP